MSLSWLGQIARRRPLRLRLTLIYTGMFIVGGVLLVAITAGLQAQRTSSPPKLPDTQQIVQFRDSCRKVLSAHVTVSQNTIIKCKAAFNEGARAGAVSQSQADQRSLLLYSGLALAIMALLSAILGWIIAGRALRPVQSVTDAARRASEANLTERISLTGPRDELKELADTFDAMLERLDAAFSSQRRFVANASHELRTPLTLMQTSIDVTLAKRDRTPDQLEQMAADVRQAAARAEGLIEALLTLARSDAGIMQNESLDLAVIAEDALDAAAPVIKSKQLRVDSDLAPARSAGDPVLVERMVANLVDNAARHNIAGGWIRVATGVRGDRIYVDVSNSGAQVPDSLLADLFEPFRRLTERTEDANGVGLGLSIARSVAGAHRGTITASSRLDGGLDVSVLLPRSPANQTLDDNL
ncbi:MAG TPA: HAMP domain-containing sensor histidine kinase [Streptosporangiaceae bacterium]|nr:HAMP domain-containing sensor histidine kinase [Streptosporangiaceae bacterium]